MTSGLEVIRNRILEKARDEATTLVKAAVEEKNARLSSAGEKAKQSASRILEDAKVEAEIRYEEKLGAIRTDLRRQLLTKREELIEEAWKQAMDGLRSYVNSEGYRTGLKELIVVTAKLVEGNSFRVEANLKDLTVIGESKKEIEEALDREESAKKMVIGKELDCIGGVEVADPEGKVVLDRTYEARIRRLRPSLRPKLAQILAGGVK